ncbi:50S ribosomal protein L5 [Candidatus Woesearchaeota archaeon]|nr:MAG: 50S ribosomal protein L5 [Candidatus Woesearchaeota archaeon]
MNPMKAIRIEKMTLNVGAGKDQAKLNKGVILIKHLTGIEPVKTATQKRIPSWGLRPGLPIGCKLTLRKDVDPLLKQLLGAKDNILKEDNFDECGNVSFGIHEYIDIPGVKYVPEIGVMGLQICITLQRPGYRVKKRVLKKGAISKTHRINKQDAIQFMKERFALKLEEEQ